MEIVQRLEEPAPAEGFTGQDGRQGMDFEILGRMELEELLYYVLAGDGRRLNAAEA